MSVEIMVHYKVEFGVLSYKYKPLTISHSTSGQLAITVCYRFDYLS